MRTDLSQGFLDAVAAGNCSRYVVIYINGTARYLSQAEMVVQGDQVTIPAVARFGKKTVGTDLNASVDSISIPAIDRSISLINSSDFGWIAKEFAKKTQEGSRIDFRIIANGEDVLEDSLVIKEPISYRQGDVEINISCVSAMISSDPLVGSFDTMTKQYSSVSLGSIGNATGQFREDLSSAVCKLKTTALSGARQLSCDRNLVEAGFPVSGSVTVDYETVNYSSISGSDQSIFILPSQLTRTHLSGQYVCENGGTFYYDFGPGPVEVVGALMVKNQEGAMVPYDGLYSVVNGARLLLSFSGFLPSRREVGSVESSITRSWTASSFSIESSKLSVSGSGFYWANGVTSGTNAANLTGIYADLPSGAIFSRGITTINFSYNSNSVTVRSTVQQDREAPDLVKYYNSYASSGKLYADDSDHRLYHGDNQRFGYFGGFTISAPAGSTFVSGSVRVVMGICYGWNSATPGEGVWSYATGTVAGSSRAYGSSSSYSSFRNIDTTYSCSSLSQVNNTTLGFYFKAYVPSVTGSPLLALPQTLASNINIIGTAVFDVAKSNAIRGYGTIKIFGTNYSTSKNVTVSTTDYNSYINSSISLNVESGYSRSELLVATVGQISSTVYYTADAPGYPKRVVYEADSAAVKIGEDGSDVNPVDVIANLISRKSIYVKISEGDMLIARSFYDSNSYLMNGYIMGNTRVNAAMLEIMKESALMVIDRAGNVVIKRRILPADAVSMLTIARGSTAIDSIAISHQSDDECINRISVRYNADAALNYASAYSASNDLSISTIGEREEVAIDFPHVDSGQFAEYSANYWVNRNSLPFRIVEFKVFGDYGQVIEYGDFITLHTKFSNIGEVFGEVVQVSIDYVNESSPTIYTITMVSGGTTNEPEHLVVDDENIFIYEYLNLHRAIAPAEIVTIEANGQIKPISPAEIVTIEANGQIKPVSPAEIVTIEANGQIKPVSPAEIVTIEANGQIKPISPAEAVTMNDGTPAVDFYPIPAEIVTMSGGVSDICVCTLPTEGVFIEHGDFRLTKTELYDTITVADSSVSVTGRAALANDSVNVFTGSTVVITSVDAWGEFAWRETGHYWGRDR